MPAAFTSTVLFGDHSAEVPVHFSYEEFLEAAQMRINWFRASGGIFTLYTHHLGNDNDTYGDINYSGSGGVTKRDLAWMVDLVRANNGIVLTFAEAVEYYRSRSQMIDVDGDKVWVPQVSGVGPAPRATGELIGNYPNPFNPRTRLLFEMPQAGRAIVEILDVRGRRVRLLAARAFGAGSQELVWDGRGDDGRNMPAGVYLASVRTRDWEDIEKMTLLK